MYAYLCIELGNMNCCIDKLTVYTAMFYEYLKLHVNFHQSKRIAAWENISFQRKYALISLKIAFLKKHLLFA